MTPSDDVTQDSVTCPECKGESHPPANDTVAGRCWLCLGAKVVTKSRSAEAFRISQEAIPPVLRRDIATDPSARRLRERRVAVLSVVLALTILVTAALWLAWCNR